MEKKCLAKVYLVGGNVVDICDKDDYDLIVERLDKLKKGTIFMSSQLYLPNEEIYLNDEYITAFVKV